MTVVSFHEQHQLSGSAVLWISLKISGDALPISFRPQTLSFAGLAAALGLFST